MIGYRSRLERDLARWEEAGLVDARAAGEIRADMAVRGVRFALAPVLGILGAVLLSFAAMTFVAANWQDLTKLTRLLILFSALWAAYGAALLLRYMHAGFLEQAAILLGTGLFGANIMLIAQMYHISGNPPDAVLMWACGALLAGVLLRSRPALGLTICLIMLWSWWEVVDHRWSSPHYGFLLAWTAVALPVAWLRWRAGYHMLALALAAWIVGIGYLFEDWSMFFGSRDAHPLVIIIGLAIMLSVVVAGRTIEHVTKFAGPLVVYGLGITYAGLFALQFVERIPVLTIAALAGATLVIMIAALFYGARSHNSALTRLAYSLFSIELLGLYFKTLGTLLDTALFFLLAGVIVIALAAVAWALHRRQLLGSGAQT